MMKKLLFSALAATAIASADVATVLPYYGTIDYDSAIGKSLKESSKFGGVYTSVGNLGYLFEFAYNYLDTSYKKSLGIPNLKQHDLTLVYSQYRETQMLKSGLHYIKNNEDATFRDLGSGIVGIVGISSYSFTPKSKTTYGLDLYYSHYGSAHSERSTATTDTVTLWQFTPYIEYGKTLSPALSNKFTLKANLITTKDYKDDSYVSFEVSDTIGYRSAYLTLGYLQGDFRSGIRDNGFAVYNTKDLYSRSYQAKVGYYFTPKLNLNLAYSANDYREFNAATLQLMPEGRNTILYGAASYSF